MGRAVRDAVDSIRRFNRTVTERIGVLNDRYLARDRPLGASRVLWEIHREGTDVRSLRARLGLDSGYLSRLLRSLEGEGLVDVRVDADDRRARIAHLTDSGRKEQSALDALSDALVEEVLAPLSPRQRLRLVEAAATVERLLTASAIRVEVEDPRSDAAQSCLSSYYDELDQRFEDGFDVALCNSVEVEEMTAPAGLMLVARLRAEPVGCGALKFHGSGPAEIKRMWVAPSARGLGLGRRLLRSLEDHARSCGVKVVRLDTNRVLSEALALYRTSGYAEIERFNDEFFAHHWFEKQLEPDVSGSGMNG